MAVDTPVPSAAVLLMAYGGPSKLDDVEPYLLDVRGGRPTSPELIEEIRHRYEVIGGRSPIVELTRAQAEGLARALGPDFSVHVGMRHWHPFIKEAVDEIAKTGARRLVGIAMAPHYSSMSVGAYQKKLLEATDGRMELALVRSWGDHPQFLAAVADRVTAALRLFSEPAIVQVIFTAHSLPKRILAQGDPYPDELRSSARAVAERLNLGKWDFAFQSAGASSEPWLGPDAGEVIERLAEEDEKNFLIVPIGFVCDHVEILYDIDVEYRTLADKLRVRLERTESLNDHPLLVETLADVTRRTLAERGWS